MLKREYNIAANCDCSSVVQERGLCFGHEHNISYRPQWLASLGRVFKSTKCFGGCVQNEIARNFAPCSKVTVPPPLAAMNFQIFQIGGKLRRRSEWNPAGPGDKNLSLQSPARPPCLLLGLTPQYLAILSSFLT